MSLIDALKVNIEFGEKPRCKNCANCQRTETDSNAPYVYKCGYAGAVKFEVDEDDSCQKWEEM